MHLVILAWLFVTFTMALTMKPLLAGIAFFAALGLGPVALYVAITVRRLRARREREADATRDAAAASINAPARNGRPR